MPVDWTESAPDPRCSGCGLTLADDSACYVVGDAFDAFDLGTGRVSLDGAFAIGFVARYRPDRRCEWVLPLRGSSVQARAVATDTTNDAIVLGTLGRSVQVGPLEVDARPGQGQFLTRVDPDGRPRWARLLPFDESAGFLAASRQGVAFAFGRMGPVAEGENGEPEYELVVLAFDPSGGPLAPVTVARTRGTALAIAVGDDGEPIVAWRDPIRRRGSFLDADIVIQRGDGRVLHRIGRSSIDRMQPDDVSLGARGDAVLVSFTFAESARVAGVELATEFDPSRVSGAAMGVTMELTAAGVVCHHLRGPLVGLRSAVGSNGTWLAVSHGPEGDPPLPDDHELGSYIAPLGGAAQPIEPLTGFAVDSLRAIAAGVDGWAAVGFRQPADRSMTRLLLAGP